MINTFMLSWVKVTTFFITFSSHFSAASSCLLLLSICFHRLYAKRLRLWCLWSSLVLHILQVSFFCHWISVLTANCQDNVWVGLAAMLPQISQPLVRHALIVRFARWGATSMISKHHRHATPAWRLDEITIWPSTAWLATTIHSAINCDEKRGQADSKASGAVN